MGFVDETSEAFWADPHPFLSEVRERHPLARTPIALYDVLRYDDVQRLLKDPRLTQVGLGAHHQPGHRERAAVRLVAAHHVQQRSAGPHPSAVPRRQGVHTPPGAGFP